MLKHLNPAPQRPARVVILGAHGFVSTHLQAWCGGNDVAFRAVSSQEIDLTRRDNAPQLAALLRADDAIVMTSSVAPDKGRDYRTLMANLRMVETVIMALERSAASKFGARSTMPWKVADRNAARMKVAPLNASCFSPGAPTAFRENLTPTSDADVKSASAMLPSNSDSSSLASAKRLPITSSNVADAAADLLKSQCVAEPKCTPPRVAPAKLH